MKYCFDENNNLYLTLPKLNKNLNEKLSTGDYKKKVEYRYDRYDEKPENIKTDVNYEISVSYTQNEEKSSDNNSESFTSDLNEEEKLSLFDKLKTKSNFMITQIVDERSPQSQK